jgi:phosphoglycolate phosphatase
VSRPRPKSDKIAPPTLVLDLDGTLVDTAGDLLATLNVILAGEGLLPLGLGQARNMIGNGARAMLEAGFAANGRHLPHDRLDRLFADFVALYSDHIADVSTPFPGALAALDRFSADGWRLAVCTNKLEGLARRLLEEIGIAGRFAVIAGQDTFGVRKPDPRHLVETIRNAGGEPMAAVMVGDSELDFAAARGAGVPSVGVTFGYSSVPIVELGPDRVIAHFDELFDAAGWLLGERRSLTSPGAAP